MSTPAIPSEELRQSLTSIGLAICSDSTEGVPSPSQAMQAVNGGEVEPKYTVPYRSDDALGELDRLWHAEANAVSLYANAGKFLLILPGPGSSHAGWLCVQDTVGERLPSRIIAITNSPEFIAMSLDGKQLCATSREEYDYWVISHKFTEQFKAADHKRSVIYPEVRRLVKSGTSLSDLLSYLKSTGYFRGHKIELMSILREACGISLSETGELAALLDQYCTPIVPMDQLEAKWQYIVSDNRQG
ncbi:hypothetical protein OG563_18265 [Nocardia vinacea]|uniref:Uncharacterized protein n=1 Tax=Nocardia vinacea TaxID=96468 RepID=A0ABZ1Z338_9NOCA|nr:hypothetical protein [Nocardia vinacea]